MHYKILMKTAKYSVTCNGFSYVLLYVLSLTLYITICFSEITLFISLLLSIMMLYASLLSDRLSIAQLINAYSIVGLKRKEIVASFYIFANTRVLVIAIAFLVAYPSIVIAFLTLSNTFIALVYYFTFRRV